MSGLTPSREDYLKAVDLLAGDGEAASVTALAARMRVTKASASLAVSDLERLGLVTRRGDRRFSLTDEGKRQARKVEDRYDVLFRFFTDILQLDRSVAGQEACRWEHALNEESMQAMRRLVGESAAYPEGK